MASRYLGLDPTGHKPGIIVAIHEPDGEKRLQLVSDGEADVALNLERADNLDILDFNPAFRWGRTTSTLSAMYFLNCTAGIFKSAEARLAANLAVDRGALAREVDQGFALPSATIVSPFHLGFKEGASAYGQCLKRLQENPPWLYIVHPDVVWASLLDVRVEVGPSGILMLE
ncbi:hypothetical protein BDW69DRAFT_186995 [Aspergillus filifer]